MRFLFSNEMKYLGLCVFLAAHNRFQMIQAFFNPALLKSLHENASQKPHGVCYTRIKLTSSYLID